MNALGLDSGPEQVISNVALARYLGVTEGAVRKAEREGRIVRPADGVWNVAEAARQWHERTKPCRVREAGGDGTLGTEYPDGETEGGADPAHSAEPLPEAVARAESSVRRVLSRHRREASPGRLTLSDARLAEALLRAERLDLDFHERRGDLIDRVAAEREVFSLARQERDAWLDFPARVAAIIAAEVGADEGALHAALDRELRAYLLARVVPELKHGPKARVGG